MFKNPLLRTITLAATLLAAGAPSSAQAAQASGSSTVTVTVPDVIILDFFKSINLGLASQTEEHDHGTYEQTGIRGGDQEVSATGALTTNSLVDANTALLQGSDVTLTLKNVWAVRGFSSNGKATVSVTGPETLTNESTSSTIGVSKLLVMVDGAKAADAKQSITANLNGIQKSSATLGDVLLGLNFSRTTVSGNYSGTITISAVTL